MAESTIHTEIMGIREELLIVAASRWSSSSHFLIKFDSANAIKWFKNSSKTPWNFTNINQKSIHIFGRHIFWSTTHICRTGNDVVDVLTQIGTNGSNFIEFMSFCIFYILFYFFQTSCINLLSLFPFFI